MNTDTINKLERKIYELEKNKNFENKKLLLTKLMNIINKSDEFQGLCCLFFDKK